MINVANKQTEVFQAHGEQDFVVRYSWGRMSMEYLKKLDIKVEWRNYPNLDHSADPQEIADMEGWLERKLPSQGSA